MPQSYPAAWSKWETKWLSYHHQDCETKHTSGWGCILMTPCHGRRCSNALYVYELDLIWVWSGWGVSIISHSMIQVRNRVNHLSPTTTETSTLGDQISLWGCFHMTTRQSGRCWNTLYMYEVDLIWVWSGWGAPVTTHSMLQVRNRVNLLPPDQALGGLAKEIF